MQNSPPSPKQPENTPGTQGKDSSPTLPAITLPKGGGAIRGIGEKFAANPVTGTGSMTVPIATSPGRSGFGPQLSLSYDSGAGNGPFGLGWSLSLPSITRKTDKGLPQYRDAEESDVFLLSGSDDLVPVLVEIAGAWVPERLPPRTVNGVSYLIKRYRPRIEGLFARIERWTNLSDAKDVFWRSISKDNITTWYGKIEESRILDPAETTRIYSWLICESYDDKGNVIAYRYKKENSDPIDRARANEANRDDKTRGAQPYLKSIHYGNHTPYLPKLEPDAPWPTLPALTEWYFEVVLDYGEHDKDAPEPEDDPDVGPLWPQRKDPFSTYRAGFEIRTYRLCRRVLMFHHFRGVGGYDGLVRATEFTYTEGPLASFMSGATQAGFIREENRRYLRRSLPPLEFSYSEARIETKIHELDPESAENLPMGLDGLRYQWVDLDGEGLSGILTEQAEGWFYKRNLTPINSPLGDGRIQARLAPAELIASKPALSLNGTRAQFLDLAGDGQLDLVSFQGPTPGFYERTQDEEWDPFVAFESLPVLNWDDPNLKFVDLSGDGHADVLITEDEVFRWHSSLGEEGFGPQQTALQFRNEEEGPKLVFSDGTQSIYLADFSGDGLTDLARVRNGEVCYWPNLGYGRFGAKVTMDDSPWFDLPDQFDQKRVRLADIDGSGTTDILYLANNRVDIYHNQSGNGWSKADSLTNFPAIDNLSAVQVVDLLGNGTACLVWSSPLPAESSRPLRYVDLFGGQKPHLLTTIVNNLGATTSIKYAPSTKFYLADKHAGKPWITKLPFPVHVVEHVATLDLVNGNRFVLRHAFHHGYFDGEEREFRGFGMVEQWDTEELGVLLESGAIPESTNINVASFVPPVYTKTWFHTGQFLGRNHISDFFAGLLNDEDSGEYYRPQGSTDADTEPLLLDDTVLPIGLTTGEEREACRCLKGSMLRSEIYGLDGGEKEGIPYTITEQNFTIERLQPLGPNRHGVFFTHPREAISYHYEREPAGPRVNHALTLSVDEFGNVLRSLSVGYARANVPDRQPEQDETHLTLTLNRVANRDDRSDWRRTGVPVETSTFELVKPPAVAQRFTYEELRDLFETLLPLDQHVPAPVSTIPYEQWDWRKHWNPQTDPGGVINSKLRLIEQVRTDYYKDDLSGPLPLGQIESHAILHQSYQRAFTPGLITQVFGDRVSDDMLLNEGKYLFSDGAWWIPSGRQSHDPNRFFLPTEFIDPFGGVTIVAYDEYSVSLARTQDPLGSVVSAKSNYRTISAYAITDPNGNRTAVRFDALGMVSATAVLGKLGQGEGDALDDTSAEELVGDDPTCRIEYSLFEWVTSRRPNFVRTFVRERHGAANPRWQESYSYSDGIGREVMKKIQAEPGLAPTRGPDGKLLRDPDSTLHLDDTSPALRWIGSGRTVFDNKGNAIKKYEPFFSRTPEYESEPEVVEYGVSPVFHYDPLGRLIRTDHPNGSFSKVEFDAWQQTTWDENDTVLESRWHADRVALPAADPENRAAVLTAAHAGTPGRAYLDSLSRQFLNEVDSGATGKHQTRFERDIEGNQRAVIDARNNLVAEQSFDMLGHKIYAHSADAGASRTLMDVAGNAIRSWDSRDRAIRKMYDPLRRSTHLFVREGAGPELLLERTVYGESHPNAITLNLRLALHQHYDGAGVLTNERYDFKGNVLRTSRRLAREYKHDVDWSAADLAGIGSASAALLESEIFASGTEYDALNRPTQLTTPDTSETILNYNPSNVLESVSVRLRGSAVSTPFVTNIDYNAKGQREEIVYGNGTRTQYLYDPFTFRVARIRTTRSAGLSPIQDLSYTYDPVGNVVEMSDAAQQQVFFDNAVVSASGLYEYDALYRLTRSEGREHAGQLATPQQPAAADIPRMNLPHPNDSQAMRRYVESYEYDPVGNILRMIHVANNGNWTRRYDYAPGSNRLLSTSIPSDPAIGPFSDSYDYDGHGNMIQMPHLPELKWDLEDQLQSADLGGGGTAYYVQDAHGQRVRKVVERLGSSVEERIYLSGYEIFRRRTGDTVEVELETLHVMDNHRRVALVETTIKDKGEPIASPSPVIRYQLDNHLGSVCLELDHAGALLSYEEYYPFGNTSYHSARGAAEVSLKRYRYIGKERDEETGLYYCGARYYASWLGRWTSCDPAGLTDGSNVYSYVNNRPLSLSDPTGMWGLREFAVIAAVVVVGTVVTVATAGAAGPLIVGAVASVGLTGTAATVATGVAVGVVAGAAGGAAAGAAGEATRQTVHSRALGLGQESFSAGGIARAAGRGAVEGAAVGAAIGGVAALATTAAGGAAIAAVGRVGQRVVPAAVRQGAGAVGRGVATAGRAVARAHGVRQAAQVAGRAAQGAARHLQAVGQASERAGLAAARVAFQNSGRGAGAVEVFASSGRISASFGADRPGLPRGQVSVDIGGEGAHASAINLNPQRVTSTTPSRPIPRLVPGVGERLPLSSSTADLITVEGAPLRAGAAQEIGRVLRPTGEIRLVHPADYAAAAHPEVATAAGGTVVHQTTDAIGVTTTIIRRP
jgi:RHS repeat-associated protein